MPSPMQQREQKKREEKLRNIREQVVEGNLVIRQMTPEERRLFPRRDAKPSRTVAKRR